MRVLAFSLPSLFFSFSPPMAWGSGGRFVSLLRSGSRFLGQLPGFVSGVKDVPDVAIRVKLAGGTMVLGPCRDGDSSPTVVGVSAFILNFSQ